MCVEYFMVILRLALTYVAYLMVRASPEETVIVLETSMIDVVCVEAIILVAQMFVVYPMVTAQHVKTNAPCTIEIIHRKKDVTSMHHENKHWQHNAENPLTTCKRNIDLR